MMIKYRTRWHDSAMAIIETVEVLRETERQVFLPSSRPGGKERKENKESGWQNYFDTWEQAHDFLVEEATKTVDWAARQLEQHTASLENLNGMENPVSMENKP